MADNEEFPGTGRLTPIVLSEREVVELFCFPKGVIPDGYQRKAGFRWKTPVTKVYEDEGGLGIGKSYREEVVTDWDLGQFVDVGRDDVIGIAWRRIRIKVKPRAW